MLLAGAGQFIDDMAEPPNLLHAAILRSPHAHARLVAINIKKALELSGVEAVLTASDVQELGAPLVVGLKLPMKCWPIAVDKVRYVGEPVAVVVANDRYIAEDALDLIEVEYDPLPPVLTFGMALDDAAPALHDGVATNVLSDRRFSYGDPQKAFDGAAHRIGVEIEYPRNAVTPIETYGVIARYDPFAGAYDVTANFQGPFSIHAVISRSLRVPGNRLRLRTPPDSGGSFGVKQGIFPYIVLVCLAARLAGRPVKWIEDRVEHLTASVSATARKTKLEAAVEADGRIIALDWDQTEDIGAYARAPEPATLYRMHGNMTGAYSVENLRIRNRVVATNRTPTGLNRGFGGPQVYFALERLMARIAEELGLDPLDVIRRNLVPGSAFPYRTATGSLYDSGNYETAIEVALREGAYAELLAKRASMRAQGRLYGIGHAAVVEPSVSNMGYVSTVMTPAERAKAGPKNGAQATATVALDPVGSVSVHVASVPQGQGHRTVLSQVIADVFGLEPRDITVITDLDTARDAWSIASGNYSSRFAAAVAGTARLAAERLRTKLCAIAASQLNVRPDDVEFSQGKIFARGNAENAIPFARLASVSHWAPATVGDADGQALRETVFWTPPELDAPDEDDKVNSSLCHGFIFDFCGVEVDPESGRVSIDRYVTMHDCGKILHPAMVDGQVRGGFANAVGAALYEEYSYGNDGAFLSGTFADYLIPTIAETPAPLILHVETPSPFTPLGAKGVGEGNCMSTPVALANAVADAIGAGVNTLPMSPAKIKALLDQPEPARPAGIDSIRPASSRDRPGLTGSGKANIAADRLKLWNTLLDPVALASIIPGCRSIDRKTDTRFEADVVLGVGPVKGDYRISIELSDLVEPESATLTGEARGALGTGKGTGKLVLTEMPDGGTTLSYSYEAVVGGKVASVGSRLLDGAARIVIGQFFTALGKRAATDAPQKSGLFARLFRGRK